MLYVTTRNKHDAVTAYRTMNQDRGTDGGLYVPFRLQTMDKEWIYSLGRQSFAQTVADVLNLLYSTKMSAWDIEITIGRNPIAFKTIGHRIMVGELWHNMDGNFQRAVNGLAARIHPDGELWGQPSNWVQVGVRIAFLFGLYGQLLKNEQTRLDKSLVIAVPAGNFTVPMAVWYARAMGLPVGTIVCGCNENGAPWQLLHRGALDTGGVAWETATPDLDVAVPRDLERLICEVLGQEEALHYWWTCTEGGTYVPPEAGLEELRKGMFAAVVSQSRIGTIIPSVYRTHSYVLDPYAAIAYGALSDFRARTGSAGSALLWMEKSPLCCAELVSSSMHISVDELRCKLSET